MRVIIASRIYAPEPSAASYMLGAIAESFRRAGHEVLVLTARPPRGLAVDDPAGIAVRRMPVLRDRDGYVRGYLPYLSFDLPLALRLLAARRADVYLVEPPPTTGAVLRVAAGILRRPYLYDAADIWSDAAAMATSSRLVLRVLRAIELFALRGAAHAVTISAGVASRLRELRVTTPTTVVGFGADTAVFDYRPPSVSGAPPYFIYAGSYSEWHGAEVLIDGFARFSRGRTDGYRLIFVGNGSEREHLQARAEELGVGAVVEFREAVPGDELVPLLATATASLASLRPAVGYDYAFTSKVYSSFATGCPVVFAGPGPTGAFLAEAERSQRSGEAVGYSPDEVAAAMTRIADHPLDAESRRALSRWTRREHSLSANADRVVAVAESVVAARSRA